MFDPRKVWLPSLILTVVLGGLATGETPADAPVAQLIGQLNDDAFARREEASRRLTELGLPALPALAAAAQQKNAEVSARAFAVLKTFAGSDEEALRDATRRALKLIAAGRAAAEKNKDETLASAADTATTILGRPFLGIYGMGAENAAVGGVVKGSPAEKAGFKPGDIVLSIGGETIPTFQALVAAVGKKEPGDRASLEIERDGQRVTLNLTIGRYDGLPLESVPQQEWLDPEN